VARGEARTGSDVDFLVDLDAGRGVLDLSELILDLQDALGCRVDVVEGRHHAPGAERLEHDAITL
jgi:predicted nucleotidyltransferase